MTFKEFFEKTYKFGFNVPTKIVGLVAKLSVSPAWTKFGWFVETFKEPGPNNYGFGSFMLGFVSPLVACIALGLAIYNTYNDWGKPNKIQNSKQKIVAVVNIINCILTLLWCLFDQTFKVLNHLLSFGAITAGWLVSFNNYVLLGIGTGLKIIPGLTFITSLFFATVSLGITISKHYDAGFEKGFIDKGGELSIAYLGILLAFIIAGISLAATVGAISGPTAAIITVTLAITKETISLLKWVLYDKSASTSIPAAHAINAVITPAAQAINARFITPYVAPAARAINDAVITPAAHAMYNGVAAVGRRLTAWL